MQHEEQGGHSSNGRIAPRRIASLAPALTEWAVALGLAGALVGVSDYCELPEGHSAARLGGVGNPDVEALRALEPDLVLADRSPGGPLATGPLPADLPIGEVAVRGALDSIEQLAALARRLGAQDAARPLLVEMRAAAERAATSGRHLRRAVVFTWRDPWVAVGLDTYADDVLRLCGGDNVALRLGGRSPRADLSAFMRYNPEVVLLASGAYRFTDDDVQAFWRFGDVAAVRARRIVHCDAHLLWRYGARLPESIAALSALLG
jgi:ABC-type Fe3+-hydroxamate transport system substrate-binding protein